MLLKKFRVLFCMIGFGLVTSLNIQAYTAYNDNDCLSAEIEVSVKHKIGPLGLFPASLKVKKENCVVNVKFTEYWLKSKNWSIDVCRGPVHIKSGKNLSEVSRKKQCDDESTVTEDGFCSKYKDFKDIYQNHGLIYANGEKEDFSSDHGKIYCAYSLILNYLEKNIIFSRNKKYNGVITVPSEQRSSRNNDNLDIETQETEIKIPSLSPIKKVDSEEENIIREI